MHLAYFVFHHMIVHVPQFACGTFQLNEPPFMRENENENITNHKFNGMKITAAISSWLI